MSVVAELRLLPRGRGVLADDIGDRLGPLLRHLLAIEDDDDPGVIRRKVAERLQELSGRLPADLGHAVRVALALGDDAKDRFLKDRVDQLAVAISRDPRTAKRRVDEGLRRVAEMLVDRAPESAPGPSPFAPEGWYIDTLQANLLLDRDPPQLIERRRIVATRPGLDRVVASLSAPPTRPGEALPPVRADVLQGGRVVSEDHLAGGHYRATIQLPTPLAAGEVHEYAVAFTAYPLRYLQPYYVVTSFRRCDRFELGVRFDPAQMPPSVWRVDGVPPRIVTQYGELQSPLRLDVFGEVQVGFADLRPGLSYGIGWSSAAGRELGAVLDLVG